MLQVVGVRKAKRPESKGATAKDGDQNSTGEPTEQQSQDSAIPDRLEAPSRATSVQSVSSARQQETCKPVHETLQQVLRNILSNSGMHPSRTSPNAAESDATKLERDLHVVNPKHLLMPAVWQENKRPEEKFFQSFNQGRNYLLSSVRFYACLGMYNIEVFAVATVGHVGLLLFAWGEKPSETTKARVQSSSFTKLKGLQHTDVNIYIADVNCPQFEIAHEADAIRYRTFLTQLRDTQAQKIHDAFEKVREEFVSEWRKNPSARRFRWAARHQQAANATVVEPEITKLRQDLEANRDALKKLEKRKTELEALLQKSNDEKVTVAIGVFGAGCVYIAVDLQSLQVDSQLVRSLPHLIPLPAQDVPLCPHIVALRLHNFAQDPDGVALLLDALVRAPQALVRVRKMPVLALDIPMHVREVTLLNQKTLVRVRELLALGTQVFVRGLEALVVVPEALVVVLQALVVGSDALDAACSSRFVISSSRFVISSSRDVASSSHPALASLPPHPALASPSLPPHSTLSLALPPLPTPPSSSRSPLQQPTLGA
ncbi:hypothetical protein HDZ31DRAFT_63167 [Schizophyllum fasciatum]